MMSTERLFSREEVFEDLAKTLNAIPETFIEISFADPGTKKFNKGIYFDRITPEILSHFAEEQQNVAFLSGCVLPANDTPLNEIGPRVTRNNMIRRKNIISFDIDFKDLFPDFQSDDYAKNVKTAQ